MTSKLTKAMDKAQETSLELNRFYQRCMTLWLRGYTIDDISKSEGDATHSSIMQAINIKRVELRESQEADIAELVAERIGGLRQLQHEAHDYLGFLPEKAPQLLTVALRAEESIAKIQGVLSDKVLHLGRIQHEIKLYDFEDNTPPAGIVEGIASVVIEEPELPQLVEVIEKTIPKLRIETSVGGFVDD